MLLNENIAQQESEFVFRRLTETFKVIGLNKEVSGYYWLLILGAVLVVGLVFVVWMYIKDARSVRWYWAAPLGALRISVYLLLALMFLMPARQGFERVDKRSRVIVMIDVSESMVKISDDVSRARTTKPTMRLDRVMNFLSDDKIGFMKQLLDKNPTLVYRFGNRLDEDGQTFEKNAAGEYVPTTRVPDGNGNVRDVAGKPYTNADWKAFASYDFKPWVLRGLSEDGIAKVKGNPAWDGESLGDADWAAKWADKKDAVPTDLNADDAAALKYNREKLMPRVEVARSIAQATNVPDSVLTMVNREAGNMLQGIVVFSDGRSNLGNNAVIQELKVRARREQIPIFTVGIGSEQKVVAVRITDVQAPDQTPPDEPFRILVEQDGDGLAGQKAKVELEVKLPGLEATVRLPAELTYAPGEPPHGQAEFLIDPEKAPEALKAKDNPKELLSGDWQVRAITPTVEGERFTEKEHVSDWTKIKVGKRPARILVFCSAPNRDVQFFVTQMIRDKADMSLCVQNDGGKGGLINLLEDKDRQLTRFPERLNVDLATDVDPKEKWYNLAQYDVVIAFDPDWNALSADQIVNLRKWVDLSAGGFILVAGHINTKHLARPDEKFEPLINILPVLPGDPDLAAAKREAKDPWRLEFEIGGSDLDFLKLDESVPLEVGWERFFTGRDDRDDKARVLRGFYNYFPLREMKSIATPIARFPDPNTIKMPDGKNPPWLCVMNYGQGKSMWIGASEIWRLRQYRDEYFERFWTKTTRWAASGSRRKQSTRGRLLMTQMVPIGGYLRISSDVLGPDLQPVPPNTEPKITIRPLSLDNYPADFDKLTGDDLARAKQKLHDKLTSETRMSPKKEVGEWKGRFTKQMLISADKYPPGSYQVEMEIPSSSDTLKNKFMVRTANPEVDETRPDFEALYSIASSYDDIKESRLSADATLASDVLKHCEGGSEGKKLAFRFTNEEGVKLIPACMTTETKTLRNRGAVEDYWDKGVELPQFMTRWMTDKPMTVAYGLLLCTLLLSIEWMIRKLLKLA